MNNVQFRLIGMSLVLLAAVAFGLITNSSAGAARQSTQVRQEVAAAVQSLDNLVEQVR